MNMKSSTPLTQANSVTLANNKYQKALKEINKLIAINTSVKKQLIVLQEQYDALRQHYGALQQKCAALEEENQKLSQQYSLPNLAKITASCEQPTSQVSIPEQGKLNLGESMKKFRDNFSPLSIPGKELQNTGTISQYIDTKRKLQQTQQRLNQKQKHITSLADELCIKNKENAQLYQKYIEISNNLNKIKNQSEIKETTPELQKIQSNIKSLQSELSKQKQINQQLRRQNQNLKRQTASTKLIASNQNLYKNQFSSLASIADVKSQSSQSYGRPPAVPYHQSYYPSVNASLQSSFQKTQKSQKTDPFSEYYFKKVRDLQSQIFKLKKQFTQKKSKYKSQLSKLKQELQQKQSSIRQLNSFASKQQSFIESFVIKNEQQQKERQKYNRSQKMISNQFHYQKQFNEYGIRKQKQKQKQKQSTHSIFSKMPEQLPRNFDTNFTQSQIGDPVYKNQINPYSSTYSIDQRQQFAIGEGFNYYKH